jgi:hypothetical protein
LKEIAMKTFIVVTILSVGVLLRPEMAPSGNNEQTNNATATVAVENHASSQGLDKTDLNAVIGGGLSCSGEIDKNGTSVYYTCCASLWIIRVCASVYLGEIPAPLTAK